MDKFQVLLERLTGVTYALKKLSSAGVEIQNLNEPFEILAAARRVEDVLKRETDTVKYVKALDGFLSMYSIDYPSDFLMVKALLNSGNELAALEWLTETRAVIENELTTNLAARLNATDLL